MFNVSLLFLFYLLLKIEECHILWQRILIIQTLVSQENPEVIFAMKSTWFENAVP